MNWVVAPFALYPPPSTYDCGSTYCSTAHRGASGRVVYRLFQALNSA